MRFLREAIVVSMVAATLVVAPVVADLGNGGDLLSNAAAAGVPASQRYIGVASSRLVSGLTLTSTPTTIQVDSMRTFLKNATAVVVNAEVADATSNGYVRLTPYGEDSSVALQEFRAHESISNLTVVRISSGRIQAKVNAGTAKLYLDVVGYYTTTQGLKFTPVTPTRLVAGTALGTSPTPIAVSGRGGVPQNAVSIVANAEVTDGTASGYLRITTYGHDATVATQEYAAHQSISNLVIVDPSSGKIQAKVNTGTAKLYLDILGYYAVESVNGSGIPEPGDFVPMAASRVAHGITLSTTPTPVAVAGQGTVPADATAVLATVEVAGQSTAGYVRVTPYGVDRQVATQEYSANRPISGTVVLSLVQTQVQAKVSAGTAKLYLDVYGYYVGRPKLSVMTGPCALDVSQPALQACIKPQQTATDTAGNVYIADSYNHRIEKVTPAGAISIVAGNGHPEYPLNGPATSRALDPSGLAVDSLGNAYIADANASTIVKVDATGVMSVVAGGQYGTPVPGPATSSPLLGPRGLGVDASGNLFVSDYQRILKVTPGGQLSVLAGDGSIGAPVAGPATASPLGSTRDVAVDAQGNLYVADPDNHRIERVTAAGQLSNYVGGGGTTPAAQANIYPFGIALDTAANLLISDGAEIDKVSPAGDFNRVAGTADPVNGVGVPIPGPATSSPLGVSLDVAVDGSGNFFIADPDNNRVEKVTSGGMLSLFAGDGGRQGSADPGPETSGIAVTENGIAYYADRYSNTVVKVQPDGTQSIVAGTGTQGASVPGPAVDSPLNGPGGLAVDVDGNLYVADSGNNQVEKISADGILSVYAGTGAEGFAVAGPAKSSPLLGPGDLALDASGNLFIADGAQVEKVTPDGTLSIVAGTHQQGTPTPGPATASQLSGALGLDVDRAGNLYIADSTDVLKVTPDGVLTVEQTTQQYVDYVDVAVDGINGLHVIDLGHNIVINFTNGDVFTEVGMLDVGAPVPGDPTSTALNRPHRLAIANGKLYITDTGNDDIDIVS